MITEDWFRKYWADRLCKDHLIRKQGIFYAVQERLFQRQNFQSVGQIAMIKAPIATDFDGQILATLHPKETYSAAERAVFAAIKGNLSMVDTPSSRHVRAKNAHFVC